MNRISSKARSTASHRCGQPRFSSRLTVNPDPIHPCIGSGAVTVTGVTALQTQYMDVLGLGVSVNREVYPCGGDRYRTHRELPRARWRGSRSQNKRRLWSHTLGRGVGAASLPSEGRCMAGKGLIAREAASDALERLYPSSSQTVAAVQRKNRWRTRSGHAWGNISRW